MTTEPSVQEQRRRRTGPSPAGRPEEFFFFQERDLGGPRVFTYVALGMVLISGSVLLHNLDLAGGPTLHTLLEAIATVLALITGAVALVRFYSRRQTTYLFIGTGFLGTALLDAYHAAVTSPFFADASEPGFADLMIWTWITSRVFLSLFLLVSWLVWQSDDRGGTADSGGPGPPLSALARKLHEIDRPVSETSVYVTAGALTLLIFVFFAWSPWVAGAYSVESFISRPAEIVPGLLCALALVGYLWRGAWKRDTFEHWLVMGLMLGFAVHAGFTAYSREPHDFAEVVGHVLKILSYSAVLVGLMASVYGTLRREADASAAILDANAALAREVGVRGQAERVLQESEERLQDFLDHATDLIQSTDPQGRVIYVNEAWKRTLGYTDADLVEMNIVSVVHPSSKASFRQAMLRVFRGESLSDFEVVFRSKSGEAIQCSGTSNCRFKDGIPVATRSILRNVTEERRAEGELANSQANVRALFESTGDAIWSVDRDHRLITFNTAYALTVEAITGRVPQVGDLMEKMVPAKDVDWFEGCYDRALAGTRFSAVRQDEVAGQDRMYELFFNPIETEERASGVVVFSKDITRRRKVEEALKRAKRDADEANQAKSQFLANMSHELRTPLNSVIGFANILLKNRNDQLEARERGFLERIVANGKHLLSLINEILDLSKIEAGRMELALESTDLKVLVRETLAQLEGQIAGKPVQLRGDVDGELAPLLTDPGKLKQVVINLVGNALKFTEKGEVVVRVEADKPNGEPRRILVRDTGVGIPEDRLEAVFEAFQQADGSTTRRFGGTGLGLTISRSLCSLMGYSVTVQSKVGVGSTFTVHLTAGKRRQGEDGLDALEDPPRARWAPASFDPSKELSGKTVLVVDDELDSRTLLTHYLEELGCTVVTAGDGVDGIAMARKARPDLITVDLMMPRMSGWEMLRALKDDAELRDIPAVIVSVVAQEAAGQLLGAVDLISKPVDRDELIRVLRRNVSKEAGRILVVDDNPDARLVLQRYLREAGLVVHTAEHSEAALAFLSRGEVDLVLLDLVMPVTDGFTTLRRMRRSGHGAGVPVVVLTAGDLSPEEERVLQEQAAAVILKDGDVEAHLREVLDHYFRPEGVAGDS